MVSVRIETPDRYWATVTSKLKITVSQGIKDVARLSCERAARSTFPSGTTNKTKESLQKSIFKDVNYAYHPVPNNKLAPEDGNYLYAHRNSRGRVPSTTNKHYISFADYDRIKDRLVRNAGMVKAGWMEAAKDLKNTVRIPVWLRKDITLSTVRVKPDSVVVINHVRYASTLITDRQLTNLMSNAFRGLIKRAERMKL